MRVEPVAEFYGIEWVQYWGAGPHVDLVHNGLVDLNYPQELYLLRNIYLRIAYTDMAKYYLV